MTLHRRVPELNLPVHTVQVRAIVAAPSRAEAGRLLGLTTSEARGVWAPQETGNPREVSVARAQPGHVFYGALCAYSLYVPALGALPNPVVHEADFHKVRAGRSSIGRGAQQWNHEWRCLCGAVSKGNMDRATSRRDFTEHKREAKVDAKTAPTVLYFSAPWCAPCRTFGPMLAEEAKAAGVTLVKIDVDNPPVTYKDEAGSVRSVPLTRWVGDRPGAVSLSGAVKRETVREWLKVGVEDSKR